jgi:hypothetical protein
MPPIESGDTQKTIFTPDYHTGFKVGVMRQRDADMAWHNEHINLIPPKTWLFSQEALEAHNQQVRKAFAEEICAFMPFEFAPDSLEKREQELWQIAASKEYKSCLAHIRAMAGEA